MNNTMALGGVIFIIGFFTISKYQQRDVVAGAAAFLIFVGAFLVWNGYVSDYNRDPSFAMFG